MPKGAPAVDGNLQGSPRIPTDVRVSLAIPMSGRDGSFARDGYMQNVFVDVQEDGRKFIQKRPGTSAYTTFGGGGAGASQDLLFYNGFLASIADNVFTRIISPTSSGFTDGASWNNAGNAPWIGREGAAVVEFNNQIMVIGGSTTGTVDMADVWATSNGTTWTQLCAATPWGKRQLGQAVVFNGRLYFMGGAAGGLFYNDVWVTDDGVTWTQVTASAGWSARSGHSAVVFNNGIWVMGGGNAAPADVWFTTDGANWIQMSVAAGWAAANQVLGGAVVFLGNIVYLTTNRQVWSSPDGRTWTQQTAAAYSSGRSGFGYCVYNGKIWVICGFDAGVPDYLTQVWSSVDMVNWVQATAAFGGTKRYKGYLVVHKAPPAASSVINAPVMYFLGGVNGTPTYFNEMWWASVNGTLSTTYALPSSFTTPYLQIQHVPVNNNKYLAIKDTRGMAVWFANEMKQVTDLNYPAITVPGVVNLDERVYVMTPDGLIVGSALGDPFTWPSANFVGADYESDGGVALAKISNYVVAFGVYTTQLFFDSGAASQTVLRPVKNANTKIGCAYPYSVTSLEDALCWIGRAETRDRSVYMMEGLNILPISTPFVDKVLNLWGATDDVRGMPVKAKGHAFYVINNLTANVSIAYDMKTKVWGPWKSVTNCWRYSHSATDGVNNYLLDDSNKIIVTFEQNILNDTLGTITCVIVTNKIDNGTQRRKFCNEVIIVGDRTASSTVTLEYTDDDYASYSSPITFNMDQPRKSQSRFGKYIDRAYRLTHAANVQFRVEALETAIRVGN
jgi:Phage stabilisation protein